MKLSMTCMACVANKQAEFARGQDCEPETKMAYYRAVLAMLAETGGEDSAPDLSPRIGKLQNRFFGEVSDRYAAEKVEYNALLLKLEQEIWDKIEGSRDPLSSAIRYSRVGNYIDFACLNDVRPEKLKELIYAADSEELDLEAYACFQADLASAKRLVILTDNAGEIVLDKLLVRQLKRQRPDMDLTVVVRGQNVLNDATMEDARQVGLCDIARVIGNGTDIPGTKLSALSEEAAGAVNQADLLISKGQANFESLFGSGLPIYYSFLCKCDYFTWRFGLKRYQGVFGSERQIHIRQAE